MAGLYLEFRKALKLHEGRRSSVSKHPNEDVVVSVHDSTLSNRLYYCVINRGVIEWIDPIQYDTGNMPSVAVINFQGEFYAIETHMSEVFSTCYYNVGKVDREAKMINWYSSAGEIKELNDLNACAKLGRGKKPKISANDNGKIVIVYEETYRKNSILYRSGQLQVLPDGRVKINWKTRDLQIPNFSGVEPDIALRNERVILICRSGYHTIQSIEGRIQAHQYVIEIARETRPNILPRGGINPSISMNAGGYLAECHQSKSGRLLYHFCSRVAHQWNNAGEEDQGFYFGEYPTISLDEDGHVVEMHKTNFGTKLWLSRGEMRGMERENPPNENPPNENPPNENPPNENPPNENPPNENPPNEGAEPNENNN